MLKIRFNAKKQDELSKGLMFHKPLDKEECALFSFNNPGEYSFWNKNVSFPISLLFCDENYKIQHIGHLDANQEKPCGSKYPYTKYVIEGHSDLPNEHNIQIGDYCVPKNNKITIIKGDKKHKLE